MIDPHDIPGRGHRAEVYPRGTWWSGTTFRLDDEDLDDDVDDEDEFEDGDSDEEDDDDEDVPETWQVK